jgi:hypothetical protein
MKNIADWILFLSKVFYKQALHHVYDELIKQSK